MHNDKTQHIHNIQKTMHNYKHNHTRITENNAKHKRKPYTNTDTPYKNTTKAYTQYRQPRKT